MGDMRLVDQRLPTRLKPLLPFGGRGCLPPNGKFRELVSHHPQRSSRRLTIPVPRSRIPLERQALGAGQERAERRGRQTLKWLAALSNFLTDTALPAIQGKARDLGKALVKFFMDEAEKLQGRVQDEMAKVPGAIKAGLGNLVGLLVSAGEDLIRGMIKGIANMAKALADAAASAAKGALDAAKGALGIRSPSTAFAELGRFAMLGFAAGIDRTAAVAVGAVADTIAQALRAGEQLAGDGFRIPLQFTRGPLPTTLATAALGSATTQVVQQTVVHRIEGAIGFQFAGPNGPWIVSSLAADDGALNGTLELLAGKLKPIFEAALEGAH